MNLCRLCRSCNTTENGCDNAQLYRGRACCDDCDHTPAVADQSEHAA